MSVYQNLARIGKKYISQHVLFKYGFNLSPMYRRSTGRIVEVSKDLLNIRIRIPLSWKNRNYVNSIFGGSLFSAVDPIPMVQLMNLIGEEYVVWDKSAEIKFKRPAKQTVYAEFVFTKSELDHIKKEVADKKEIDIVKPTAITNLDKSVTYCEVQKVIYVADKSYYKSKRKKKSS